MRFKLLQVAAHGAKVHLRPITVVLVLQGCGELFQFIGTPALHQYSGFIQIQPSETRGQFTHILRLFNPPNAVQTVGSRKGFGLNGFFLATKMAKHRPFS